MAEQREIMVDALVHGKSYEEGNEDADETGIVRKTVFPITRWENIIGAPRLLTKETLTNAYPSQYAFYVGRQVNLSDAEFAACFPELAE